VPDTSEDHVHHVLLGQVGDLLLNGQVAEEVRVLLPGPLQQKGRGQGLILRTSLEGNEVAVKSPLLPCDDVLEPVDGAALQWRQVLLALNSFKGEKVTGLHGVLT